MRTLSLRPSSKPIDHRGGSNALARELAVAAVSTLIAFAIVDLVFILYSFNFDPFRNGRTEFAFRAPSSFWVPVVICFLTSLAAAQARLWLLPFVLGLILVMYAPGSAPMLVWSGPGDQLNAIEPLIGFGYLMRAFAYCIVFAITIRWIVIEKRRTALPRR